MSLTKLNAVSRLICNKNFLTPVVVSNRLVHRRSRLDDSFFGVASNLMRNLENEFNQMRNSLLRSSLLPPMRFLDFPLIEKPSTTEDLISVDDEGNRKFQLQIDLKGFEPEEINLETKGNLLTISAKKEKKVNNTDPPPLLNLT
jgi:hypothetical protein